MNTDYETCIACGRHLDDGALVRPDYGGGYIHADCCDSDRQAYCDIETGEPLTPDEPIPEPMTWKS